MDILHVIILALLQGITEFLPISSSAHLILPKELLGWPDQGLAFDVAVHVGTLLAVLTYFRNDVYKLIQGWFHSFLQWPWGNHADIETIIETTTANNTQGNDAFKSSSISVPPTLLKERFYYGRLAWLMIIATIPAGLFGLFLGDFIEENLRSITVIATTTIIFGLLLAYADKRVEHKRTLFTMSVGFALFIGVAQALALIPGTSRSGITITAALLLGFSREDSARFSFLLSIPVIVLSGGFKGLDLAQTAQVDWFAMVLGVLISAASAYLCIYCFLSFINRLGMMPFVYYRLILGGILVAILLTS